MIEWYWALCIGGGAFALGYFVGMVRMSIFYRHKIVGWLNDE